MPRYIRLYDVAPAYRAALDEYNRDIDKRTPEEDIAAWQRVMGAARDFRSKVRPFGGRS
jgi:hypothetical protein